MHSNPLIFGIGTLKYFVDVERSWYWLALFAMGVKRIQTQYFHVIRGTGQLSDMQQNYARC